MYKIYLRIFLQEKVRYKSIKWNNQKLKRKISKTIEQNLCPCPCFKNASLFIHRKKQLGLRVQHSRVLFSCWSREHTRNVSEMFSEMFISTVSFWKWYRGLHCHCVYTLLWKYLTKIYTLFFSRIVDVFFIN